MVRVVTGSAKGAGTDACVFVQLIGNAAKMDAPQELAASLTTRQPFERGQVRHLRLSRRRPGSADAEPICSSDRRFSTPDSEPGSA